MNEIAIFEEKIFEQILNMEELSQINYDNLVKNFISYNKRKFKLNGLETEFCDDLPMLATTNVNINFITSIQFSSKLLQKESKDNNLQLINMLQTLNTISHEFAHVLDYSENVKSHQEDGNYRNFNGELYMNCSLFRYFDLASKLDYNVYGQLLYFCSREECFARHFSNLEIINFVKKLKTYTEKKYPQNKKFLKDVDFLLDGAIQMKNELITNIATHIKYKKKYENQVKEDYRYIADKLLKKDKFSFLPHNKIKNKNLLIHYIGSLSVYDEFFNQETAEKFLKHFKKQRDFVGCVNILKNKNFIDKKQDKEKIKKLLKKYNTEMLL